METSKITFKTNISSHRAALLVLMVKKTTQPLTSDQGMAIKRLKKIKRKINKLKIQIHIKINNSNSSNSNNNNKIMHNLKISRNSHKTP